MGAEVIVISLILLGILVWLWCLSAKADWLVMVADIRRVSSEVMRYFVNLYNTNRVLMAVWIVALILACGGLVGLWTDVLERNPQQESNPRQKRDS